MALLNDDQIMGLARGGMIDPFVPHQTRVNMKGKKVISYGLSTCGYDLRLSDKEFKIFNHIPGTVVDPKDFNLRNLDNAHTFSDDSGSGFIIPGNSYGLGVAVECLRLPRYIAATCMGKSTYARVGVIVNVTPAEPGWEGHLTIEFSNSSPADVCVYANEGIAQLMFWSIDDPRTSYADRNGKYQGQTEKVTLPRL